MEPPDKLPSTINKFLLSGVGCGVIVLCMLICGFFYVWRNPPTPRAAPGPVGFGSPPTGTSVSATPAFDSPPTLAPTLVPTFDAALPTLILSPLPISFDGTPPSGKIAFTCYIKQIDQICLMNADGTGRVQLTDFPATAYYPSISPDGLTIYFVAKQSAGFDIYSMDVNGNNVQRLTKDIGSLYAPELSPNGERILFTNHGNGLWVMKPDGKNPHPITTRDDIDPTWSPDGSMIAFASSRAGARQLFVMNTDGSNVRQVTDLNNMGGRSTWSPDGTRLAFYRGADGDHNIYVINVDGSGLMQLTNGGDNLGPSWSPDGNWIAFTSFRDGNNEIYVMHPDGTGVTRLTNSPISDWQPRWGR